MRALAGERDPLSQRQILRSWLAEHPAPTARQLAVAGLVAPHWPEPWGLAADPHLQLLIAEELDTANVELPDNLIGIGWAGPTIVDDYVVTGQKIWSTWANRSKWGILLARTDTDAPKHKGISYFIVDMASPGVEVRKIIEMTGGNHFNEVFLDEVRIPVANRIGAEGDGWRLANVTLGNERVSLSEGGVLWGFGPSFEECMNEIRRLGAGAEPVTRQRAAKVYTEGFLTQLLSQKIVDAIIKGEDPSPYASIRKAKIDVNAQALLELITDLAGPAGMLGLQSEESEETDPWHWAFLFSRALTIGGGTSEIQRNIIGEKLLGLPREPRPRTQGTP